MALIVKKVSEAFYTAEASPPKAREKWKTEKPLRIHELLDQLLALGIHQIDADDAVNDADRGWIRSLRENGNSAKPQ